MHGGHRYKGRWVGTAGTGLENENDFDVVSRDDGNEPDADFEGLDNVRGSLHSPLN